MRLRAVILVALCIALGQVMPCAQASITVPGADGSDGAFNPTQNVVVDLSQAVTGHWDDNNAANAGKGVYDPDKWAVVFKYTDVNIPYNVTVTFANHPSGAPVVWLVSGNVSIEGTVSLRGPDHSNSGDWSGRAPGGFRGGPRETGGQPPAAGLGPGGGHVSGEGRGYYFYGGPDIRQLIGGSGGANGGGAGGGALLIACANTIGVSGSGIDAAGGNGYSGGSGGAVRLVSDSLAGGARITCEGANGAGPGRVRLEANHVSWTGACSPAPSVVSAGTTATIWQPDGSPTLKITSIGGVAVPSDTHAGMPPFQDFQMSTTSPIDVTIQATNVPTTWNVVLRAVSRAGADASVNATLVSGDGTSSIWTAQLTLPQGFTSMIARASQP